MHSHVCPAHGTVCTKQEGRKEKDTQVPDPIRVNIVNTHSVRVSTPKSAPYESHVYES